MSFIKKIYDWVLHWAETPYGVPALILLSFAEASFFPIPPDALLIALVLGLRKKAFKFATYCTAASVLGALLGYSIGYFAWWNANHEFSSLAIFFFDTVPGFNEVIFFKVQNMFNEWNFWVIFTAGFTPIPYKVFIIASGAFDINLIMFVVASVISRSARFFLVAGLIWKYGDQIKEFIDKYFNLLAIAFTVLLIGGFVVIRYIF